MAPLITGRQLGMCEADAMDARVGVNNPEATRSQVETYTTVDVSNGELLVYSQVLIPRSKAGPYQSRSLSLPFSDVT